MASVQPRNVGQLRAAIKRLPENHQWTIPDHLPDSHFIPSFATGAAADDLPLAKDAKPIDLESQVSQSRVSGPLQSSRAAAWHKFFYPPPITHFPKPHRPGDPWKRPGPPVNNNPLPDYVDWRSLPFQGGTRPYLTTIQNQNPCQNCWAFAVAAQLEALFIFQHGLYSKRSEGDIRDGWIQDSSVWTQAERQSPCAQFAQIEDTVVWCEGNGVSDPAAAAWQPFATGYSPSSDHAARTIKIPQHWQVDPGNQKPWIDGWGPLLAKFTVYDDFEAYTVDASAQFPSATLPSIYHKTANAALRKIHIVVIVGYDDRPGRGCWIVRNSWGPHWGDNGYGYIGYGEADIDTWVKIGIANVTESDPWTRRRVQSGSLIQGANGSKFQNLELLRSTSFSTNVQHLSRNDGTDDFNWSVSGTLSSTAGPTVGALCFGQPALVHSTAGNRNFECLYWELSSNLRHWTYSQTTKTWIDGGSLDTQGRQFATRDSTGQANTGGYPGLCQSNFTSPGNLEAVVRTAQGTLQHWSSTGAPGSRIWNMSYEFGSSILMSGPALVQSNAGPTGHFYVVCVLASGQLQLFWKDTSPQFQTTTGWQVGETFGSGLSTSTPPAPVMIQGVGGMTNETSIGNFDLCIVCNGQVQHWQRDNSALNSETPKSDGSTAARWTLVESFGGGMKNCWGLLFASRIADLECVVEMTDGTWQDWARQGPNGEWQEVGAVQVQK